MTPSAAVCGVRHALAWLGQAPQVNRIGVLVREMGVSERQLERVFRRQVGMRMKHHARLLRFRALLAQVHGRDRVDWSGVALDGGYCDQAHLANEFRRFAGIAPSAFVAARGPHVNHIPLD